MGIDKTLSTKLIRHLNNEALKSQTLDDNEQGNIDAKKVALLSVLSEYQDRRATRNNKSIGLLRSLLPSFRKDSEVEDKEEKLELGLMRSSGIKIGLIRLAADSLGKNYNTEKFDTESYSLALAYEFAYRMAEPYPSRSISPVLIHSYVSFALQGRISVNQEWVEFADSYIKKLLVSEDDQLKKISEQFPLMAVLVSEDPKKAAHKLILKQYEVDSLEKPQDVFNALVDDRIKNTRIPADLFTSMYALPPFNFVPLEIIYLSTLVDFLMPKSLVILKEKLIKLPPIKDEAVLAMERFC